MTKKCKFDVEVTYNSDYFAEGEIRDTIKKAIKDLNDQKEKKFGRLKLCDPGKTNHGVTCSVKNVEFVSTIPRVYINESVEVSDYSDEKVDPKIVLPDDKIQDLLDEVKIAFDK